MANPPTLVMAGLRLMLLSHMQCRFNSTLVNVQLVRLNHVRCFSPALQVGFAEVKVVTFASPESSNMLQFEYVQMRAHVVEPGHGPVAGVSLVRFHGHRIGQVADSLSCEFGSNPELHISTAANASSTSANDVSCMTPHVKSPRELYVRLVSHSAFLARATLRPNPHALVHAFSPRHGPSTGGTAVTVDGAAFAETNRWTCLFGTARVPARVLSEEKLECRSPPPSHDGSIVVLSVAGARASPVAGDMMFTYVRVFHVHRVHPSRGPVLGGTAITVSVHGLSSASALPQAQCVFDAPLGRVPASFQTSAQVTCISPIGAAGGAGIIVTSALFPHTDLSSRVTFYYVDIRVSRATPLSGPVSGQTRVTLYGKNLALAQNSTIVCMFDGVESRASAMMLSQVTCTSPSIRRSRSVELSLESRGHGRIRLSHAPIHYYYYSEPMLKVFSSTVPLPVHGGSTVTILFGMQLAWPLRNRTVTYPSVLQRMHA